MKVIFQSPDSTCWLLAGILYPSAILHMAPSSFQIQFRGIPFSRKLLNSVILPNLLPFTSASQVKWSSLRVATDPVLKNSCFPSYLPLNKKFLENGDYTLFLHPQCLAQDVLSVLNKRVLNDSVRIHKLESRFLFRAFGKSIPTSIQNRLPNHQLLVDANNTLQISFQHVS